MVHYICHQCETPFVDKDICPNCGSWDIDTVNDCQQDNDEDNLIDDAVDEAVAEFDENGDDSVQEDELEEIDDPN